MQNKENKKSPRVIGQQDKHAKLNMQKSKRSLEVEPCKSKEQNGELTAGKEPKASKQAPKRENLDKEIEEMAKKMKLDNQRKMEHLKTPMPVFNNSPRLATTDPPTEPKPDDWTSVQGQFGWVEIGSTTMPYLTRRGEKYVSMRMAENKIFCKYRTLFTDEVRNCFRVKIAYATTAEAHLFNEINFRHCDNFYGKLEFSVNDSMILLTDLKEMYEFFNHCYLLLIEKVAVSQYRCGFIKIAGQNCVPYVWYGGREYVPLFYFEGECKYLEERAVSLSGWVLAYLKLYCKIQGIRKNLYDGNSISVVEMDLVKKFFPPDTLFELSWPADCRLDPLIQPRPIPKLVFSQSQEVPRTVTSENLQTNNVNDENSPNIVNNGSVPEKQHAFIAPKTTYLLPTPATDQNIFRVPQAYPYKSTTPSTNNSQVYSSAGSLQSPRVIHKSKAPPQNTPGTFVPITTGFQKTFANSIANNPQNNVGYKVRPVVYRSGSRVLQITDVTCNSGYFIVKIPVEKRIFQHCINMEPYITTILLVTLEEASAFFDLPLNLVINAVNVMNLDILLPNRMQKKEFEKCKVYSTKGLLKLQDFVDNLPQLKYILSKTKNFND